MYAIINAAGELVAIVPSTDGYDLTDMTVFEPVPEPPHEYKWDVPTQSFLPRDPYPSEVADGDLVADPRWAQLRDATPAQIETWLTNNLTSLADARVILKLVLLALRSLYVRKLL